MKADRETMKPRGWDAVGLGAIVVAAGMSIASFDRLPERVATHFDLHGEPNGWMSPALVALGMPVFTALLWTSLRFVLPLLPRVGKARVGVAPLSTVASMTAVFVAGVHALILYVALVPGTNLIRATHALLGMLWISLGLVLPRVRRNPVLGIRTAWTLTSDENWARTHRVGGYTMTLGGVAGLLVVALFPGARASAFALTLFLTSALVPVVYSVFLARRLESDPR